MWKCQAHCQYTVNQRPRCSYHKIRMQQAVCIRYIYFGNACHKFYVELYYKQTVCCVHCAVCILTAIFMHWAHISFILWKECFFCTFSVECGSNESTAVRQKIPPWSQVATHSGQFLHPPSLYSFRDGWESLFHAYPYWNKWAKNLYFRCPKIATRSFFVKYQIVWRFIPEIIENCYFYRNRREIDEFSSKYTRSGDIDWNLHKNDGLHWKPPQKWRFSRKPPPPRKNDDFSPFHWNPPQNHRFFPHFTEKCPEHVISKNLQTMKHIAIWISHGRMCIGHGLHSYLQICIHAYVQYMQIWIQIVDISDAISHIEYWFLCDPLSVVVVGFVLFALLSLLSCGANVDVDDSVVFESIATQLRLTS